MEYLTTVLQKTLKDKIGTSGEPPHDVTDLAKHIGDYFRLHLQGHIPELIFLDPEPIGTAAEGLQIGDETECDFLLNIQVPSETTLVAVEPNPECPGSWLVQKTSDDEGPRDKFMENGPNGNSYFAPLKVSKYLHSKLDHVAKTKNFKENFPKVEGIEQTTGDDDVMLKFKVTFTSIGFNKAKAVKFTGNGPVFSSAEFEMHMYLGMSVGHRRLMAKPHPSHSNMADQAPLLWIQGFAHEERDMLLHADRGCVRQCLRLMKHLGCRRPKQFGPLTPFVYKTLLFYVMEVKKFPEEWREEHLAERFQDLMVKLGDCLKEKRLDEFHQRKKGKKCINVFIPRYEESYLEELGEYVDGVNEKGEQGYIELFQS
ncbi:uncharacterized protein LOC135498990 [Lineus longissimus]|uniref:uncharacterized protein LOC135498990 n=1 Tax=Lineus longissimus TaxID=88925 RepID=UPI002B4EC0EE